ncbi:hypothetical protein FTO68_10045 [Methanocalculus taiwanensis]|uniref:DUF3821 domain-containing protein n=1 Tax=Methanocalculus taiwanensis TaxID=106207 RepID=A0ABD4TN95_9EURY|nr:hypothetical protein [Methanocalculus taiwanensis]MCQ1539320.1 hypothetical protein [Methanocalculus taiwanensis]
MRVRASYLLPALFLASLCMLPAGAWTTELAVTSGGTTIPLVIRVDEAATDGFDAGLDIPLPPAPPGSTFSAYLAGTGFFPMLQTDIRNAPGWTLCTEANEPILISWDPSPVPLTITVSDQVYPMSTAGEATLPAGNYQLQIEPGADPLPMVTATPQPTQIPYLVTTAPPPTAVPTAAPPPTQAEVPDPERTAPLEASEFPETPPVATPTPDASAVVWDEPVQSPAVWDPTSPAEAGLSLLPVVGSVIIVGCLIWRYPRSMG